jgi:hypothetical protein
MNLHNKSHVMLDIETLGTSPGCAVVSVGAVKFDILSGHASKAFYKAITIDSNVAAGLTLDANTIAFWLKQDKEAQNRLFEDPVPLAQCLYAFKEWMQTEAGDDSYVWGNGVGFDCSILKAAFNAIGHPQPWNFRNELDLRTLVAFKPEIKANMPFEGTKHDPIADCMHQIKYAVATYKAMLSDPGKQVEENGPNTEIQAPYKPKTLVRILHCKNMSPIKSDPNYYYSQDIEKFKDDTKYCIENKCEYILANVSTLTDRVKLFYVDAFSPKRGFSYNRISTGNRQMLDEMLSGPDIYVRDQFGVNK